MEEKINEYTRILLNTNISSPANPRTVHTLINMVQNRNSPGLSGKITTARSIFIRESPKVGKGIRKDTDRGKTNNLKTLKTEARTSTARNSKVVNSFHDSIKVQLRSTKPVKYDAIPKHNPKGKKPNNM